MSLKKHSLWSTTWQPTGGTIKEYSADFMLTGRYLPH